MRIKSPTLDEPYHLIAGYIHLTKKDFDHKSEHSPLIRQLAALPLLFFDLKFPKDTEKWLEGVGVGFGKHFLFSPGNNVDQIIFFAQEQA